MCVEQLIFIQCFALQIPVTTAGYFPQLQPLSFGEGIALDPLPSKEVRWADLDG